MLRVAVANAQAGSRASQAEDGPRRNSMPFSVGDSEQEHGPSSARSVWSGLDTPREEAAAQLYPLTPSHAPASPTWPLDQNSAADQPAAGPSEPPQPPRSRFFLPTFGLRSKELPWRLHLHLTLTKPTYSPLAFLSMLCIVLVIALSCATFILETVPEFGSASAQAVFENVEVFCISFFLVEYVLRIGSSAQPLRSMMQPASLLDLVAIAPYFIERCVIAGNASYRSSHRTPQLDTLRIVRIVRLVRVFRLKQALTLVAGNNDNHLSVVLSALRQSADTLGVLLFLLLIAVLLFSTLIFFAERNSGAQVHYPGSNPQHPTPAFTSIPDSFWWCIVTILTVGYGDTVPVSYAGKTVAGLCMVSSLAIMALPISVVGANFSQQWLLHRETAALASRTRTCGARFEELQAELGVHAEVLDNVVTAVAERQAAMRPRSRRLRASARRAGLPVEYASSFAERERAPSCSADSLDELDHEDQPDDVLRPRQEQPRGVLHALEEDVEELLAALAQDEAQAGDTLALAELISSEQFGATCDATLSRHTRLAAMCTQGAAAAEAATAVLTRLADDRATRPGLLAAARQTGVPGLEAAAAAAAALFHGALHGVPRGASQGEVLDKIRRSGSLTRLNTGVDASRHSTLEEGHPSGAPPSPPGPAAVQRVPSARETVHQAPEAL